MLQWDLVKVLGVTADRIRKNVPQVVLDEFNDNKIHPIDDGFDVIIRIGRLVDSGLLPKNWQIFQFIFAQVKFSGAIRQ